MRARAVTGVSGHRLVCGWDLTTLHSNPLGTGSDEDKVYSHTVDWEFGTLYTLIHNAKTRAGRRDYRYDQIGRHIIDHGYPYNWKCGYGKKNGVICARLKNFDGDQLEIRISRGKIYERLGSID